MSEQNTDIAPTLLDLFCCAGGAGMGYHRAGFAPFGVDLEPQPNYPFPFHQGDALAVLDDLASGQGVLFTRPEGGTVELFEEQIAARHASPPCQPYSTGVSSRSSQWVPTKGKDEPALIGAVHELLAASNASWVIENVMGARGAMPDGWFLLCGAMFDRPIPRHRVFATNVPLLAPEHPNCRGLAKRSAVELGWDYRDMSVTGKGRHAGTSDRWSQLLGITWPMTQHQLAEAIPPAYTEWIGRQVMAALGEEVAAMIRVALARLGTRRLHPRHVC